MTSNIVVNLVAALELMGPRYRTFAGMVICMFFATAMSLLALLVSIVIGGSSGGTKG